MMKNSTLQETVKALKSLVSNDNVIELKGKPNWRVAQD